MEIIVKQMPLFKKAYKKLHKQHKIQVDNAVRAIIQDPEIGEEKKGDLAGIFVYKFHIYHQESILAYQWDSMNRLLITLGVHENFYHDLKIFL